MTIAKVEFREFLLCTYMECISSVSVALLPPAVVSIQGVVDAVICTVITFVFALCISPWLSRL